MPEDAVGFVPRSDSVSRSLWNTGFSNGKQALMTPRRASREVKSAMRQYVSCACKFVGSPILEVAWTR